MNKQKRVVPSEHSIQKTIKEALQLCNFEVQETTAYLQKGPSGIDRGIPDLLVWVPGVPMCIGIEVKRDPKAKVSPEQRRMVENGHYAIATNPADALEAVWHSLMVIRMKTDVIDAHMEKLARVRDGLQ